MGTLANSEDPHDNVAFYQSLHCFPRQNRSSKKNNKIGPIFFKEITIYDPFIYALYYIPINDTSFELSVFWLSEIVDEAIPLDHLRRFASRVSRWYDLIHST